MRILQLTDLHLSPQKNNQYNQHFINAMKFIKSRKDKLNVKLIVVTGDISHAGEASTYKLFFNEMDKLDLPYTIMGGNHDNHETLRECSLNARHMWKMGTFSTNHWALYSLDTVVPGEDYGLISEQDILHLEYALAALRGPKIALFMHHHLLPVGTPLVDSCKLLNAELLLSLCQNYPIHFIGTGHAHTLSQQKIGDTLISVAPALSAQWVNGTREADSIMASGFNVISFTDYVYTETHFM